MRVSNQKVKYYTLAIVLSLIMLALTLLLLQNSISCVDQNGCLFEHCAGMKFKPVYKQLINDARRRNPECKFN